MTFASDPDRRRADDPEKQTLLAVAGLVAIAAIVAVNVLGRPRADDSRLMNATGCAECATVVAVRSASREDASVEIQMRDGSRRTLRHRANGFSVGDVVEVKGNALTLRDVF